MKLYVGTSGFSYREWKGSFYPPDLPEKHMLHFYARHFRTVEINNTFYRMPKTSVLEAWAQEVPANFKFVLKASQRITHVQRLKDVDDAVAFLLDVSSVLDRRLGALLFQMPPSLKKDVPRLQEFLQLLPSQYRVALEFRHASWFDEEVYSLLRDHQAAMCMAEIEGLPEVPFVATADWGYLRLHKPEYSATQLKAWVKQLCKQDWREAFVFFKHEEAGAGQGPRVAQRFMDYGGKYA